MPLPPNPHHAGIVVATACDDNYAPHCGAMLTSLVVNNPDVKFRMVILAQASDLSEENRARFSSFTESGKVTVEFKTVAEDRLSDLHVASFSLPCWYRIFLTELLPECPRALYLDADTIITGEITELWETALENKLFAAAKNPLYPYQPQWPIEQLQLPSMDAYLNSGVLVLDLEKMRADKTLERLLEYAQQHPENRCPDQDALSVVCEGQWQKLDPIWNTQSSYFYFGYRWLGMSVTSLRELRDQARIIHYIGPNKPWQFVDRHPKKHLYLHYRKNSPWGACQLENRSIGHALLRWLPFTLQMRLRTSTRRIKRVISHDYKESESLAND